jgi:WD40 repeat protein
LAFSQDGRFLAGGTENNISIWDLTTDRVVQTLRITDSRADIASLTFSNDGTFIAAVDARGVLRIWHVINPTVLYSSVDAGLQSVVRVAFSPNSQLLAFQEGSIIRLYGVLR